MSLLNREVVVQLDLHKSMQLNKAPTPLWELIFMQVWGWTTTKCVQIDDWLSPDQLASKGKSPQGSQGEE